MEEFTDRQGAISAVLIAGFSVVFYGFATSLVFWLSHATPPPTGHTYAEDDPLRLYNNATQGAERSEDYSMSSIQILFVQCLIEAVFMSSAVGVPSVLAYLARQAEEKREEERLARSERASRHSVGDEASEAPEGSLPPAPDLLDAWDGPWAGSDSGDEGRVVTFNPRLEFDPPPPPPVPPDLVQSCLKYATRPAVVAAAQAHCAAAIVIAAIISRQIEAERERTPMPISLPPRSAALLCLLYGLMRFVSTLSQYEGIAASLGLTEVGILAALLPAFSAAFQYFKGMELNRYHYPGFVMSAASVVFVFIKSPSYWAVIFAIVGAGFNTVAHHIFNAIRPQVHPYFIAVSFNLVGIVVCGFVHIVGSYDSPHGQQWTYVMVLCVCTLIADTASASGVPESQYIPVGFARAIAIALALGLQTVVLDTPPSPKASLGAVLAFTAYVLLEIGRMSSKDVPYMALSSFHWQEPDEPGDDGSDPPPHVVVPVLSPRVGMHPVVRWNNATTSPTQGDAAPAPLGPAGSGSGSGGGIASGWSSSRGDDTADAAAADEDSCGSRVDEESGESSAAASSRSSSRRSSVKYAQYC